MNTAGDGCDATCTNGTVNTAGDGCDATCTAGTMNTAGDGCDDASATIVPAGTFAAAGTFTPQQQTTAATSTAADTTTSTTNTDAAATSTADTTTSTGGARRRLLIEYWEEDSDNDGTNWVEYDSEMHYLEYHVKSNSVSETTTPYLNVVENIALMCYESKLYSRGAQDEVTKLNQMSSQAVVSSLLELLENTCDPPGATIYDQFATFKEVMIVPLAGSNQNLFNYGIGGGIYSSGAVTMKFLHISQNIGGYGGGSFMNQLTKDAVVGPHISVHGNDGTMYEKKNKDTVPGVIISRLGVGTGMFIGGMNGNTDAAEFILLNNVHVYMNGMDLSESLDNRKRGARIGGGITIVGQNVTMKSTRVENNVAQTGGGIAILNGGQVKIIDHSILRKNVADLSTPKEASGVWSFDNTCEENFDVDEGYESCGCGGGSMYVAGIDAKVTLLDSEIVSSMAKTGGGGGVKLCRSTTGVFERVLFEGNRAGLTGSRAASRNENNKMSDTGGAIRAIGAHVNLLDTVMKAEKYYKNRGEDGTSSAGPLYTPVRAYEKIEKEHLKRETNVILKISEWEPEENQLPTCTTMEHFHKIYSKIETETVEISDSEAKRYEYYEFGSFVALDGAGVHISSSEPNVMGTLTIRGGSMIDLSAERRGGVIYADSQIAPIISKVNNSLNTGIVYHDERDMVEIKTRIQPVVSLLDTTTTSTASSMKWTGNRGCEGGAIATNNAALHMSLLNSKDALFTDNAAHRGGFVWSENSMISINDVALSNNSASSIVPPKQDVDLFFGLGCGGQVYSGNSTELNIRNTLLTGGIARDGGGICVVSQTVAMLENVTIEQNTATVASGGIGGGLYVADNADVILSRSTIRLNTAKWGGGFSVRNADVAVKRSLITGNTAHSGGGGGGAYVSDSAALTTSHTTFKSNTAKKSKGGALYALARSVNSKSDDMQFRYEQSDSIPKDTAMKLTSILLHEHTLVEKNEADDGGAICVEGAKAKSQDWWPMLLAVNNSVIDANSALLGGAFHIENAAVKVDHTKVTGNKANHQTSGAGGAVYMIASKLSTSFEGNSVEFEGNEAPMTSGGTVFISSKDPKNFPAVLDLKNGKVTESTAKMTGGHISATRAMINLLNVKFSSGTLTGDNTLGGTLYLQDGHLTTNGADFGMSKGGTGGCIYASDSNLTIASTEFHDCTATSVGGAMYVTDKTVVQTASPTSTLYRNQAESGAGLYATTMSTVNLDDVLLDKNMAAGDWGGDGAAIFVQRAEVNVAQTTFTKNTAQSAGGAVYVGSRGTLTGKSCQWSNNDAPRGGAMMIGRYATVKIQKHIFTGNTAIEAGGAVASSSNKKTKKRGYPIILTNCVFKANAVSLPDSDFVGAETYGGGLDLNRASAKLIGCQFDENTAEVGGGLSIRGRNCEVELEQTEFVKNVAAEGGGVYATGKAVVHVHSRSAFRENVARGETGCGGGMLMTKKTMLNMLLLKEDSIDIDTNNHNGVSFESNTAYSGGGVCLRGNSRVQATGTNFTTNVAKNGGGGGFFTSHTFCDKVRRRGDTSIADGDNTEYCMHLHHLRFERNQAVMGYGILWEDWNQPRRPLFCQNCTYYHEKITTNENTGELEATTVIVTTKTTTTTTGSSGTVTTKVENKVEGDEAAMMAMFDGDRRANDIASNSAKATFGMYISETKFGWLNDTKRISHQDLVEMKLRTQLSEDALMVDSENGGAAVSTVNATSTAAGMAAAVVGAGKHVGEVLESGVPFCNAGVPLGDPETCQAVLNCNPDTDGYKGCDVKGMLIPHAYVSNASPGELNYALEEKKSTTSSKKRKQKEGTKGWRHTPHIIIADYYDQINVLDTSSSCQITANGLSLRPSSGTAKEGILPFCTTNQDGYSMCTQDPTMSKARPFQTLVIKGDIGTKAVIQVECYTWDGEKLER